MKRHIIINGLLLIVLPGISQQESTAPRLVQNNYLLKAKKQNTAAWVLLGGGFTFTATGIIGGSTRAINEIGASFNGEHDKGFRTSTVFFILGVTAMLSSIPFFVASTGNRKKAAAVFLRLESAPFVIKEMPANNKLPAIGIKLQL